MAARPSLAGAPLLDLGDELLLMIMCRLELEDVARASRVCRRMARLAQEPCIWQVLYAEHGFKPEPDGPSRAPQLSWQSCFKQR